MPAAPGDFSGKWFLLASPTGSGLAEFHNVITSSNWSSSAKLLQIAAGGPFPSPWGTSGNYPTNSRFLPTFYVKNLESVAYTQDYYEYIDSNTSTEVISVPQNTSLVSDLGIITGSNFSGRTITGSSDFPGSIGSSASGSIGFQAIDGAMPPIGFVNVVSMSLSPNSFTKGFNFSTFLPSVDNNFRLIYRDFTNNAEAFYDVLNYNNQSIIDNGLFSWKVDYISSTGTLVSGSNLGSGSITFINKNQNQKTFIVVGAANPRGDQLYANQFTVGTVGGSGDYRSGIIKIFVTESNNTADWTSLIRTVTSDNNVSNVFDNPYYYSINHNLIAFTGSAGISSSYYLQMPDAPA